MLAIVMFVTAAIVGVVAVPVGLVGWAAIAIVLAAYWLAVSAPRRIVLVAVPVTAIVFAGAASLVAPGWWTGLGPMAPAAMVVGAALGAVVRSGREVIEQQVRRRVVEERLRIARDVHDLVAHRLAIVTVQGGVAAHLLPERPAAASEAIDHVRAAGAAVLDELGLLLSVLRGADDVAAPAEPVPRLADLGQLLDAFAAAGLRVEHAVSEPAGPLPATVEATAYRIVQESLTNASRHGDGRARLTLTYAPGGLRIEVRNGCVARRSAGTGHGLVGMRERATTVGGSLVAGQVPGGEFVVEATLPVPREVRS